MRLFLHFRERSESRETFFRSLFFPVLINKNIRNTKQVGKMFLTQIPKDYGRIVCTSNDLKRANKR
jgi:hypothetical protein